MNPGPGQLDRDDLPVRSLAERHALSLDEDALHGLARYTALLRDAGSRTNLVGTRDPTRLLDEVVLDAAHLGPMLPPGPGRLIDVGSGAGVPGIPVLLLRPDWQAVLVEPRRRRAAFLRHAVHTLGLAERARIVEDRLEHAMASGAVDPPFEAAAAKAVFAPADWAACAAALVPPGGLAALYLQGHGDGLPPGVDPDAWTPGPTARWVCVDGSPRQLLLLVRASSGAGFPPPPPIAESP